MRQISHTTRRSRRIHQLQRQLRETQTQLERYRCRTDALHKQVEELTALAGRLVDGHTPHRVSRSVQTHSTNSEWNVCIQKSALIEMLGAWFSDFATPSICGTVWMLPPPKPVLHVAATANGEVLKLYIIVGRWSYFSWCQTRTQRRSACLILQPIFHIKMKKTSINAQVSLGRSKKQEV